MSKIRGFFDFIREQGVVGLAVGFVLGGSVKNVVTALVEDLINPFLGILLGAAGDLQSYSLWVGAAEVKWGHFLSVIIDFMVVAAVIYFVIKGVGLDKLDKKKS